MLKTRHKIPLLLLLACTIFTCISPYSPELSGYKPMLVVEGKVTSDNRSYFVKLSLSKQETDSAAAGVTGANVYISDGDGNTSNLTEYSKGIYKTDSLDFIGEVGKSYQLHIRTAEGNEYVSDTCTMYPVPGIDTTYFEKDERLASNQTVIQAGLSIYVDTKSGNGVNQFLRWDFEETWKFKIPYPTVFAYYKDDSIPALSSTEVHQYCYKSSSSSELITGEILSNNPEGLKKQLVNFIASEASDRLTIRYSILINQYSISQKEYNFWSNLRKMNETEGDIFGSQPYSVLSNIHNVNDPTEPVLGYFSVSAVVHERKFIDFNELTHLNIPFYHTTCKLTAKRPGEYQSPFGPPFTFDDLYYMFTTTPGWAFVEPVYDQFSGNLIKLAFTSPECADCRETGTDKKPDFWIE